ncbi:MAG: hypothetical protein ACE5F1_12100, partial [Planctomycetota bacterium]
MRMRPGLVLPGLLGLGVFLLAKWLPYPRVNPGAPELLETVRFSRALEVSEARPLELPWQLEDFTMDGRVSVPRGKELRIHARASQLREGRADFLRIKLSTLAGGVSARGADPEAVFLEPGRDAAFRLRGRGRRLELWLAGKLVLERRSRLPLGFTLFSGSGTLDELVIVPEGAPPGPLAHLALSLGLLWTLCCLALYRRGLRLLGLPLGVLLLLGSAELYM